MAATITDVAKRAGVSVGTVSRFLNGYQLRDHNAEQIRKAIESLGYRANILGKALRNQRSMIIGAAIHAINDIYSTTVLSAIEPILERKNYSIVIRDCVPNVSQKRQKLHFLLERQIDGLILFPFGWEDCLDLFQEFMERQIPIVLVDGNLPGLNADRVHVDNKSASFRAVEKFIHMNHRRIAIINGPKGESNAQERYQGCVDALNTYNIEVRPDWVKFGDYSYGSGYRMAMDLLQQKERPTALFAASYGLTIGTIMAINELSILVPEDLSVIGFDHFQMFDIVKPPLTVIEQPTDKLGAIAAKLILKRIGGDRGDFPSDVEVTTRMLIRQSLREI